MSEIFLGSTIPRQMKHFWTIFLFYKSPRHSSKTLNGPPVTAPCYCTIERHILWMFQNISMTLCKNFWVFVFLYLLFLIQVAAENMSLRIILINYVCKSVCVHTSMVLPYIMSHLLRVKRFFKINKYIRYRYLMS